MSAFRFAKIVPLTRTRAGLEVFDYALSENHHLQVGDLVPITFRKQAIYGLVWDLVSHSDFASRLTTITATEPLVRFGEIFVELVEWTARRTFQPAPNILKAWLREFPKKVGSSVLPPSQERSQTPHIQPVWTASPLKKMVELVRSSTKKRLLIITPWRQQAEELQQQLSGSHLLTGETPTSAAYYTWTNFLQRPEDLLITTKLGAWLGLYADEIFCLEPENDDHKQEEASPRYDTRLLLAWMAQTRNIPLTTVGLTPPLHVSAAAPEIPVRLQFVIRQPGGGSVIPMLQAETVSFMEAYAGPKVVIHPIRGLTARLRCRECQWEALCPTCRFPLRSNKSGAFCDLCRKGVETPISCPSCGSVSLNGSLPGLERLQAAWQQHYAMIPVSWRDARAESLLDLPARCLVVVTEPNTIGGFAEDVRRRERLCLAYRRLTDSVAEANGTLLLQVREEDHGQWLAWLNPAGVAALHNEERHERRVFHYPPSVRLVKLLFSQSAESLTTTINELKRTLTAATEVRGPFPVAYRASRRGERSVVHILFPPETPEAVLTQSLKLWAAQAIIDLDPTVFLR